MTLLARTIERGPVIGTESGFVPLDAVYPELDSISAALTHSTMNELKLDGSTCSELTRPEDLNFSIPLEDIGKIWGIGLNYNEHATDLNENRPESPASFMKPASTVVGPGGNVRLPAPELTDKVTAEAELGLVIGRTCSHVPEEDVQKVIAGYLPLIDMTAEDILEQNPRYLTKSKSFDSFLVLGPWISTPDVVDSLADLQVQTIINDEVKAENVIQNMKFKPEELVAYHSKIMTLHPGDVILTGTPGAHVISPGDEIRASIDGIGSVSANVIPTEADQPEQQVIR